METELSLFLDLMKNNIVSDYFTPNIKFEVILDMLLTPILAEIVEVVTGKNTELIAKEFPLLNRNLKGHSKKNYKNFDVDYLLKSKDEKIWYLTELKATESSESKIQRKKYKRLAECKTDIYADFVELLLHIYGENYGSKGDSLHHIFQKIIKQKEIDENSSYTEVAHCRLKSGSKTGSKKYLYTAAGLLEKGIGFQTKEPEYESLEIIYITPNGKKNEDGITYLSIKEIIKNEDEICKRIERENNEIKQKYWKWLIEILKECYVL